MIRPAVPNKISLRDLKRCKMTPIFFDTFFNLEKYLDHEQRDPFATQRETDEDGNEVSGQTITRPFGCRPEVYTWDYRDEFVFMERGKANVCL